MNNRILSFVGIVGLMVGAAFAAKNPALVRESYHDSVDSPLYISLTEWVDSAGQNTFTNSYEKPFKMTSMSFNVPAGVSTDIDIVHYRHIGKRVLSSNAVVTAWNTGQPDYYTTTNYVKAFTIQNAIVTNKLYSSTFDNTAGGSGITVILTDEDDLPDNWWILGNDRVEFEWSALSEDFFCVNYEK